MNLRRALQYLFLWPGMDARKFLDESLKPNRPSLWNFAGVYVKILIGLTLLLGASRIVPNPMLATWLGMWGLILCLHFGTFHLAALLWRRAGVDVSPLMNRPLFAASLTDFWSCRWNTAFNQIAFGFVFHPLARRCGTRTAMLATFAASGVVHDLVISIPAHGGYGLPTAYFLFQGIGVLLERSAFGRRIGLNRGARGWLFTMVVVAAPVFWLFHPTFVHNVMLPFFHTIKAF